MNKYLINSEIKLAVKVESCCEAIDLTEITDLDVSIRHSQTGRRIESSFDIAANVLRVEIESIDKLGRYFVSVRFKQDGVWMAGSAMFGVVGECESTGCGDETITIKI